MTLAETATLEDVALRCCGPPTSTERSRLFEQPAPAPARQLAQLADLRERSAHAPSGGAAACRGGGSRRPTICGRRPSAQTGARIMRLLTAIVAPDAGCAGARSPRAAARVGAGARRGRRRRFERRWSSARTTS